MAPNVFWLALPAPSDILRSPTRTPVWDGIASLCQILMVSTLLFLKNREASSKKFSFPRASLLCGAGYYTAWLFYYRAPISKGLIVSLWFFPCAAFLSYAWDRKNIPALIFACLFSLFHLISLTVKFML